MANYSLTNKAVSDLSAIWEYRIDAWSEKQADKYYLMLLDTCKALAERKIKGKSYPEISAEILGYRSGEHILFFRILSEKRIEIVRILHTQMDLKNRIQK